MHKSSNQTPITAGRPKKVSRAQIVEAALEVMKREGFDSLSMRSLARQIGLNHTTLYNYIDHISDIEEEALALLMAKIPIPNSATDSPLRQQLIEHFLAVREVQILFPRFCHAPPGSKTWLSHMAFTAQIADHCANSDEQLEDFGIGYNTIIGVVAYSAEHYREFSKKGATATDLEAIRSLPRAKKFEPLFRTLHNRGQYSKRLALFVYRLDYLITRLIPHIAPISDSILHEMQVHFLSKNNSSLLEGSRTDEN